MRALDPLLTPLNALLREAVEGAARFAEGLVAGRDTLGAGAGLGRLTPADGAVRVAGEVPVAGRAVAVAAPVEGLAPTAPVEVLGRVPAVG